MIRSTVLGCVMVLTAASFAAAQDHQGEGEAVYAAQKCSAVSSFGGWQGQSEGCAGRCRLEVEGRRDSRLDHRCEGDDPPRAARPRKPEMKAYAAEGRRRQPRRVSVGNEEVAVIPLVRAFGSGPPV